jgi:uncharacterized cupredoxin-like copper-binding protein
MLRINLFLFPALLIALFLSACGAAASPKGPVTVNVTLKEYTIESSITDFKPGVQYHFVIKNAGNLSHEFMMMPAAMGGMDMAGMPTMTMGEMDKISLMMIPQEQLAADATVEKDYTFTSIPTDSIEIICALPGHLEAGMRMPITIQ